MREIKFRAWDKERKEMFVPHSITLPAPNADYTLTTWLADQHGHNRLLSDGENMVLMQFTGLKDKNGKEIYEGDIIHGAVITDTPYTAECPSLQYFHWYQELEDAIEEGKQIEVIGNIYANPSLIT